MKTDTLMIGHFTDTARFYDERNLQLAPIADNMHFLIRLVLRNAPERARVLCVGIGTGVGIACHPCHQLREKLSVISPGETESLLKQSGIQIPVRFFQAFMISGWHGIKKAATA